MMTDENPLLDDLFAEAREEAVQHSFADTKKTLLAGLAIGGAGLLGAKIITSSILKSKFFIMSISAVTILTSAVLVYTTGLKPTTEISDSGIKSGTELQETNVPMGSQLPENLFVMADQTEPREVEPEDSTIVIESDTVIDVEKIVEEVLESIDIEGIEESVAEMVEAIGNIEIDIDIDDFEEAMEELVDNIEDIEVDIDIDEEELADLKLMIADFSKDTMRMEELKAMVEELELMGVQLAEQAEEITIRKKIVSVDHGSYDEADANLTRRVFTITNNTTDEDLEDFNQTATAAGIEVNYQAKIWSSKIRNLNMRLKISNGNNKQTTDIHIQKIKRGETFVHNIIWYENDEGQAVKFTNSRGRSSRSSCSSSSSQCQSRCHN